MGLQRIIFYLLIVYLMVAFGYYSITAQLVFKFLTQLVHARYEDNNSYNNNIYFLVVPKYSSIHNIH